MPLPLAALLPEELVTEFHLDSSFRGIQLFKWIQTGCDDFSSMTNLPIRLRTLLEGTGTLLSSCIAGRQESDDGSVKYRIRLRDRHLLEAVLLRDRSGRKTVCLSTQVGCAMGCLFCRTGCMGLIRNLEAFEIVEEFLILQQEWGKISNIVFMGMGEPLLNLAHLRKTIAVLTHSQGIGLNLRRITVSTCGIVPGILSLAEKGPYIRLAFSLITAVTEVRSRLMPADRGNSLKDVKAALVRYQNVTGKRDTLEVVLMGGINTSRQHAEALIRFIPPLRVNVNLIPWNPSEGLPFRLPSREEINTYKNELEIHRIPVTQRYRRGRGVDAACGQLFVLQDGPNSPHTRR